MNVHCYFTGSSELAGLQVLLSPNTNHYVSYKKPFDGIDVSIHGRDEYDDTEYFFSISPGYDVNVVVTPSVLVSDKEVRSLSPSKRNCLFDDEVFFYFQLLECMLYENDCY